MISFSLTTFTALLYRFWLEYSKLWKTLILRDFLYWFLFFVAFGYGLGAVFEKAGDGDYLMFLAPGVAASSGMMVMTMAMTYGVYERFNGYRVWQSWLATPARLHEVMLAELTYASLRTMPSTSILVALAFFMGGVGSVSGALLAIPLLWLANVAFGAVALCFTSFVSRALHFAYVQTLWITPMYLFSGVFFKLEDTPTWMQTLTIIFPLPHLLAVVRPLMMGEAVPAGAWLQTLTILTAMFAGAFAFAHWRFKRRLFK